MSISTLSIYNILNDLSFLQNMTKHDLRDENCEFPYDEFYVGLSNSRWSCEHFYEAKRSNHCKWKYTYGGYLYAEDDPFVKKHYNPWWTMNSEKWSPYFWTSKDRASAEKFATLLRYISDYVGEITLDDVSNIHSALNEKRLSLVKEIEQLDNLDSKLDELF